MKKNIYINQLFQQKKRRQNPGLLRTRFAYMVFKTAESECERLADEVLAHPMSKTLFRKKETRSGRAGDDYIIPLDDFNKWLIILTKVFVRCQDVIGPFVRHRARIEKYILAEDYEEALYATDQMESDCGVTMWSIESRIGLLCLMGRNLEAHEYCTQVVQENKSESTRKLVERLLMKYELNSYSNFIPLQLNSLHEFRSAGHSDLADFISLHVLPLEYDIERRPENVFRSASPLSVCDLYHFFQKATLELLATNSEDYKGAILSSYKELCVAFYDKQVEAIIKFYSDSYSPVYSEETYAILKDYSCGEYKKCIYSITSLMKQDQSNTAFLEILARCHIYENTIDDIPKKGIAFHVARLIAKSLLVDDNCSKYISEIETIVIRHNSMSWSYSISAQKNNLFAQSSGECDQYASRKLVLSGLPFTPKYFALSRSVDFGVECFEETKGCLQGECDSILSSRKFKYELMDAISVSKDISLAENLLKNIDSNCYQYLPYELESIKYEYYELKGDHKEAFEIVSKCCVDNVESYRCFPLEKIIDSIGSLGIEIENVSIPILYHVYSLKINSKKSYLRDEAYEDYINFLGGYKPSLIYEKRQLSDSDVFFLKNICVPYIMDISPEFESNLEILAERINIIDLLLNSGPDDEQLFSEKESIYDDIILEQSKLGINNGKLYVDIDTLKSERGAFYRSLFESYKRTFNVFDEVPYVEFADTGLALPKGSKDKALYEILENFLQDFVKNPDYGLDKYLSTDIRHGVFSNHIRSCLENARLVTDVRRDGEYGDNEYWSEIYDYINRNILKKVDDCLRKFSSKIDEQIAIANEWMKVSFVDVSQERVFDYRLPLTTFDEVKRKFSLISEFDIFFDALITFTWSWTEHCADKLVAKLNGEFRASCDELFDDLRKGINRVRSGVDFKILFDSIEGARSCLAEAIEHSTAWFRISKDFEDIEYTVDSLVKIARQSFFVVKGERGVEFEDAGSLLDLSADITPKEAKALTSALFTAYENAVKHGHSNGTPVIYNYNEVLSDGYFSIEISNYFDLPPEYENSSVFLAKQKAKMYSRDPLLMHKEGGSGLYKINRLLKTSSYRMEVDIDVKDDMFVVIIMGKCYAGVVN